MTKPLDQLTEREIRSELLYCQNNPVKKMILEARLQDLLRPSSQKVRTHPSPRAPTSSRLTTSSKITTYPRSTIQPPTSPRSPPSAPGNITWEESDEELLAGISGMSSDEESEASDYSEDDLEGIEMFMEEQDERTRRQQQQQRAPQMDQDLKRVVARDHLNNNMMDRMNEEMMMRTQGGKREFEPPFAEGGTDEHPAFHQIDQGVPKDFSNRRFLE